MGRFARRGAKRRELALSGMACAAVLAWGSGCAGGRPAYKIKTATDPYSGTRTVIGENNLLSDSAAPGKRPYLDHGLYLDPFGSRDAGTGALFDLGFNLTRIDFDAENAFGPIRRMDFVADGRDSLSFPVHDGEGYGYTYSRPDYAMMFFAGLAAAGDIAVAVDDLSSDKKSSCRKCCEPAYTPMSASFADEDFTIEEEAYKETGSCALSGEEMHRLVRAKSLKVTIAGDYREQTFHARDIPKSFLANLRRFWDALTSSVVPEPEVAAEKDASPAAATGRKSFDRDPTFGSPLGYPSSP